MDWLSAHHSVLECFKNVVTLSISGKPMIRYQGDRSAVSPCFISALTVRKLLAKGVARNFGICVGQQEKGSSFGVNFRSKRFFRCFLKEIEFGIDVPQLV